MDTLKARIKSTLDLYSNGILLQDDHAAWTGQNIQNKITELQPIIEKHTWPQQRVGIVFSNSAAQAVTILATIMAGRIPVILSHLDVSLDPMKWLYRSKLSLVLASEDLFLTELHPIQVGIGFNSLAEITLQKVSSMHQILNITDYLTSVPAGTALMLYTSGSTGEPKGVFVPEKGLLETIDYLQDYFQLSDTTVSPILLPVCHSMALNTQFLPTFLKGGRCYFINSRLSMGKLFRQIQDVGGTFISMIGEVLRTCVDEKKRKNLPANTDVLHVQMAGGMILPQHIAMAKELFPNATLHKGYGLTEAIRVTMLSSQSSNFVTPSVGKPLPFQHIEIRSSNGQLAPFGEIGEIFVKGPNVMLGVCGAAKSKIGEDRFLATGDLGYFNSNGELCIAGRADSVFKINGQRISGLEIEALAREASALIQNAKCIAVPDEKKASFKVILFLEISRSQQSTFFNEVLKSFQLDLWHRFKKLNGYPRDIVVLHKFPHTSNGKIKTKGLEEVWIRSQYESVDQDSSINLKFFKLRDVFNENLPRELKELWA